MSAKVEDFGEGIRERPDRGIVAQLRKVLEMEWAWWGWLISSKEEEAGEGGEADRRVIVIDFYDFLGPVGTTEVRLALDEEFLAAGRIVDGGDIRVSLISSDVGERFHCL
jgi:hypothetical protein